MKYLVNHLLEASAEVRPDAVAVVDGEREIDYGTLDERANQVANVLRECGVARGDRVCLYLDKSIEAVIGIYGVLKAGAAYVPLDPQAPPTRLAYIAADAGAKVLISGKSKAAGWATIFGEAGSLDTLLVLDDVDAAAPQGSRLVTSVGVEAASAVRPSVATVDLDLAYILYTSGSTGAPKGVMLTHRNCLAFVEWAADEFAVTAEDRVSSHAPLHFDLSTFDLYAAALAGAPLVLVPAAASVFPVEMRRFIELNEISVWYSVPSILTMLAMRGGLAGGELPKLRTILFAGEVFPTEHLRRLMRLLPHVRFANLFGPTETNVCTWWEVTDLADDMTEAIPIGRAIANVEVFAVADDGRLAPPGEVGELYVRGPTVMEGYLGDAERTAERLVVRPFGDALAQRTYRTGDLVQEIGDGNYRFLGRRDNQIKSRGYRIELGDVESALYSHSAVLECAVLAIPDELISNRLKAYVSASEPLSKADLVRFCAEKIPQYMIPDEFEFRSELPRTSTGKVNRQALQAEQGEP